MSRRGERARQHGRWDRHRRAGACPWSGACHGKGLGRPLAVCERRVRHVGPVGGPGAVHRRLARLGRHRGDLAPQPPAVAVRPPTRQQDLRRSGRPRRATQAVRRGVPRCPRLRLPRARQVRAPSWRGVGVNHCPDADPERTVDSVRHLEARSYDLSPVSACAGVLRLESPAVRHCYWCNRRTGYRQERRRDQGRCCGRVSVFAWPGRSPSTVEWDRSRLR